jgi:hypothetical protein
MKAPAPVEAARGGLRVVSIEDRRKAVVAMVGSYVAAAALWHLGGSLEALGLKAAAVLSLAVSIGAYAVLFYRTGYWTWGTGGEAELDERQLAVRNRCYAHAYAVFVICVFVAMLYYHIASDAGLWLPDRQRDWEWVFWGVLVLGVNLPSILLAWLDRPVPEEE